MPDSCGPYNPNGCTKSCQECYEGEIAGVTEYRCYGQCVVVDAYGRRHLGPGIGPPAGWKRSAGDSMAEMIADEIANINNSELTPTSQLDCCSGGPCPSGNCWSDKLNPCKCQKNQPPNSPGQPVWKPYDRPTILDIIFQTTTEEQKAALATARAVKIETKKFDPVYVRLCKGLCDDALSRVKAWLNDWYESCKSGPDKDRTITTSDGVVHPYCYYQYNSALKAAKDSNYNCKSDCTTTGGDFQNPYPDSTQQDETSRATLATARLNFNKRGDGSGGGTLGPFKYRPKKFTQEMANIYCNCNGSPGCGIEKGACGGTCWWMNHLDVTKDDPNPVPLPGQEIVWKCSAVNEGPWSPVGDPLRETETEQVSKVALEKARRAANFDRNSTNPTMAMGGPCENCLGNQCREGYLCWHRQTGTDTGNIKWECKCFPQSTNPNLPTPGGWTPKFFDKPSASVIKPTPMY